MNNLRGGRLVLAAGILHVIFSMLAHIWWLYAYEHSPPGKFIRMLPEIGWICNNVVFLAFLYLLTRHEKAVLIAAALYAPAVLSSIFMSPQPGMGIEKAVTTMTHSLHIAGLLVAGFMIYRRLGLYGALMVAGMAISTNQNLRFWDIPIYTKSFNALLLLLASLASASKYVVLLYWHRLYETGANATALFRKVNMSAGMAKWKGFVVFLLLGWAVFFMAVGLPKNLASIVYMIGRDDAGFFSPAIIPSFILNAVAFLFMVWCFRKFILEQYYATGIIPGWGYWVLGLPLLRFIPWLALPIKAARERTEADGHAILRKHRMMDNDHFKTMYWLFFSFGMLILLFFAFKTGMLGFPMIVSVILSGALVAVYLKESMAFNYIAIFTGLAIFPIVITSMMRGSLDIVNSQLTYLPGLVSLYLLHPLFHPERIVPYPELPAETAIIHVDSE